MEVARYGSLDGGEGAVFVGVVGWCWSGGIAATVCHFYIAIGCVVFLGRCWIEPFCFFYVTGEHGDAIGGIDCQVGVQEDQ